MRSLLVVVANPIGADSPDLVQILEDVGIEYFLTVGTVESLDIGVLVRLTGLDVARLYPVAFAPSHSLQARRPWRVAA